MCRLMPKYHNKKLFKYQSIPNQGYFDEYGYDYVHYLKMTLTLSSSFSSKKFQKYVKMNFD